MIPSDFTAAPSGTRVLMIGVLLGSCGRGSRSVAFGDRCIAAGPDDVELEPIRRCVQYRADGEHTVWRVLHQDGTQLFLRSGGRYTIADEAWVEDVTISEGDNA